MLTIHTITPLRNVNAIVPGTSDVPSTELMNTEYQSTGEKDVSYAIVRVWINDGLRQNGPLQC